jgi:hypothetical protein
MEDYPSNSMMKRNKGKKPKIKKITKGAIVEKKKPILLRIFDDNANSVGRYIFWDVLLPAVKTTIIDVITNGIEMLVYGEGSRPKHLKRRGDRSYVSYNSIHDERRRRNTPRTRHSFGEVILDSREDAETVLDTLVDYVDRYDEVTVADFYHAVGLESEWADNEWGWDSLGSAQVRRTREGYIIIMPKPMRLD